MKNKPMQLQPFYKNFVLKYTLNAKATAIKKTLTKNPALDPTRNSPIIQINKIIKHLNKLNLLHRFVKIKLPHNAINNPKITFK